MVQQCAQVWQLSSIKVPGPVRPGRLANLNTAESARNGRGLREKIAWGRCLMPWRVILMHRGVFGSRLLFCWCSWLLGPGSGPRKQSPAATGNRGSS